MWLDMAARSTGMISASPFELEDHYRAALYKSSERKSGEKRVADYEDFPENPLAKSKEDFLRQEMQSEQDPKRKHKLRVEFIEYKKWKRTELAKQGGELD
jgi:hypothetical protein